MSFQDVQETLEVRMDTEWGNTSKKKVKVAYANANFKPTRGKTWMRFTVNMGDGIQASMGATVKQERHFGVIIVQIFVGENETTRVARELADLVGNIFRYQNLPGNIICRSPKIVEVGTLEGWWQTNVQIEFQYDDFVTPI